MTFYINEFRQHLSNLTESAKREGSEYTEPVDQNTNTESLTETYSKINRTVVREGTNNVPHNYMFEDYSPV